MFEVLGATAEEAAPRLLGSFFIRQIEGRFLVGKIVEVEAYGPADAASHSFRGQTKRNSVMFGPSGRLYVYFTYGLHYCLNIVCGDQGDGSAVLVRAVEPVEGIDLMSKFRKVSLINTLTNGPAKVCQAFQVNMTLNGHDLRYSPFQLVLSPSLPITSITQTTRIGISQDISRRWRFYIAGNAFVSRK